MPTARSKIKEKQVKGKSITFLARDIIFEILSWLPVQSLLRCKCVCKQWYDIIQDPKFIENQNTRSTTTFVYTCTGETPNIDGIEETFFYLHACLGLLLERNSSYKYRIRNPATRQILDLPQPHKDVVVMLISFVQSAGNYKLVSIYGEKGVNGNGGCEVLTIGSDDLSWRPLNIPNLHDLKKRENLRVLPHREIVYCFRFVEAGSGDSEVVCLNLENENFTSMKVPHYFFSNWKKVWPVIWNGKVSLVGIAGEELTVWVSEDYKKQKWAERKIVIALTFMKENPSMKESLVPCGYAGSHRVTFYVNYLKLLVYYIDTKEARYSETAPEGKRILCFNKSNLVTLKGMQPQMKQITNELAKSD